MLEQYSYLLSGILALFLLIISVFILVKRRGDNSTKRHSVFDYVLIWPLLIEQHKKRSGKHSNKVVIIGLIIMFVLIVIGMVIGRKYGR